VVVATATWPQNKGSYHMTKHKIASGSQAYLCRKQDYTQVFSGTIA
jgi:hypothetical protein